MYMQVVLFALAHYMGFLKPEIFVHNEPRPTHDIIKYDEKRKDALHNGHVIDRQMFAICDELLRRPRCWVYRNAKNLVEELHALHCKKIHPHKYAIPAHY